MAYPFVGGNYPHASYIPNKYSPKLLTKYYDNTVLTKLTNSDYVGEFRSGGDQITIRKRPDIATFKYRVGQAIPYTDLQTEDMVVKVQRMRGYAFKINSIEEKLSDLKGWVSEWTDEGAKKLGIDVEKEFFSDIYAKCDTKNCGATAGVQSGLYNLGTAGSPLILDSTNIVKAIVNANATVSEQTGWENTGAWMVVPVWASASIKMSDLHKADMMGDTQTSLRSEVNAIGKVGGFDIYQSNLLPDLGDGVVPILFGNRNAITYANTISITEVKDNPYEPGKLHSSIMVYDWFSTHPEFFGVMLAKPRTGAASATSL